MDELRVSLFGEFAARCGRDAPLEMKCRKAQELFSYLLLHRMRPTTREIAATILWQDASSSRSRAYLRRALWQLQTGFKKLGFTGTPVLLVEPECIQCNPTFNLWLDVDCFEHAYEHTATVSACDLTQQNAHHLEQAVELYEGDLLASYPYDWCLCERERLRYLYLTILDKLTEYHQYCHHYTDAIAYAERALAHDRAREHTHRQLMLLRYQAGQRTEALRQYETCANALRECLDVLPSVETQTLREQIRAGQPLNVEPGDPVSAQLQHSTLPEKLASLDRALTDLSRASERVRSEIRELQNKPIDS